MRLREFGWIRDFDWMQDLGMHISCMKLMHDAARVPSEEDKRDSRLSLTSSIRSCKRDSRGGLRALALVHSV